MNAPSYTYIIKKRCAQKITAFYRNVSKKYKHTYSEEWMPATPKTCMTNNLLPLYEIRL